MRLALLYLFLVIVSCESSIKDNIFPISFEGRIVAIKDGDTYNIMHEGKEIKIRLEHIDCPEKSQPFGKNAKQFASNLCFGKTVKIINKGNTDRYKRLIAEVYVDDICVNKELIKNGLAWHFKKYSESQEYTELENIARQKKLGLWVDLKPIPPWEWRKK